MKNLSKILMAAAFFSLTMAFCACAEEVETKQIAVSEGVYVIVPASQAPAEKTTLDNLQAAFNGESNAHARYLAFAKKADAEGYGKAATLFRAAARAEKVHFDRHAKEIKALGGTPKAKIEKPVVKSTKENLKAAMDGEIYESTVMYPEFLAKAEKDGVKNVVDAFEDAGKAEAVHASLYKKALENLPEWKSKDEKFYVCTFCGNIVEKIDFMECPLCGKSKDLYLRVR
jgi:rubrerythrin